MRKNSIPYAHATSLFEIPPSFFERLGVKVLLCDLDNTLAPYGARLPDSRCIEYKKELDSRSIQLVICSNGTTKRVAAFGEALRCSYYGFLKKPSKGPLLRLMKENQWKKEDVLLVGDQIQTDVVCANRAGIRCLLTEPLGSHEPPWTHWNRLFDYPKRKKILKRHWTAEWREIL